VQIPQNNLPLYLPNLALSLGGQIGSPTGTNSRRDKAQHYELAYHNLPPSGSLCGPVASARDACLGGGTTITHWLCLGGGAVAARWADARREPVNADHRLPLNQNFKTRIKP
jgi:hypothetical protein